MKKTFAILSFIVLFLSVAVAQSNVSKYVYKTSEFTIDTVKYEISLSKEQCFVIYSEDGFAVKSGYGAKINLAFLKRPAVYMIVITTSEKKFEKYKKDYKKAKKKLHYFKLN